MIWMLPRTSW